MGSVLRTAGGDVTFTLDLERDDSWVGRPLTLQVLRPGGDVPSVPLVHDFVVGDVVTVTVPLDLADGDWVLLRVADPAAAERDPGAGGTPRERRSGSPTRARGGWRPEPSRPGAEPADRVGELDRVDHRASTTYGAMPRRWISTFQPRSAGFADDVDRRVDAGQRELVPALALGDLEHAGLDRHGRAGGARPCLPEQPVSIASDGRAAEGGVRGQQRRRPHGQRGARGGDRRGRRSAPAAGRGAARTGPAPAGAALSSAASRSSAGTARRRDGPGGRGQGRPRRGEDAAGEAEDRAARLPLVVDADRPRPGGTGRDRLLGQRLEDLEPVVVGVTSGERRSGGRRSRQW